MMVRTLNLALVLVAVATSAQAQITTYVAPQRASAPSREMVAAADSARRDSAKVEMANMKAWVDSAAGITVPETVGLDDTTRAIPVAPVAGVPPAPSPRVVTTFEDGSIAPATASNIPTLAVVGVVFLAVGSVLLVSRRG
jgi:hypothetical protein